MKKFINYIIYKFIFFFKFKTLKSIILLNDKEIIVQCSKGIFQMNRKCPHQGANLEKAYKKDNVLTCHWHGCKIIVNKKGKKI
tara:strand:- start:804 stop:1052 length:249 start_codon:yes stop_codon:yes gene_type:complete